MPLSMDIQYKPTHLDTLCDDLVLQVALRLTLDDLLSFSTSCKKIYSILRCSNVWKHWLDVLPPAFIHPPSSSGSDRRDETVRAAIIRAQHLRNAFSGRSKSIACKEVAIFSERWGVHVAGTQWMFSYGHSTTSIVIQCVNLVDGSVTGELPVAGKLHSSKTISGQLHERNETLLAILCDENHDHKRVWSVSLVIASSCISDETGMTTTTFTHLKSLSIPDDIGCLFSRFDVLQISGDYIVISGNWNSKAFLLVDWKRELMAIHRCSRYWRTFDWKIIASKLFIVYDDCQVDIIDVPPRLDQGTESPVVQDILQVITLPEYTDIQFSHHGSNSFSVLIVTDSKDGNTTKAPFISHTQMTLDADSPILCHRGSFDGLVFSEGSHTTVSSSGIAYKGAKGELTVWSMKGGGVFCEVQLNIAGCPMEILDVDLEIGMMAVKEGGYGTLYTPQIKAYWIL